MMLVRRLEINGIGLSVTSSIFIFFLNFKHKPSSSSLSNKITCLRLTNVLIKQVQTYSQATQ